MKRAKRLSGPDDPRLTWTVEPEPESLAIEGNASAWGEPEDSEYAAEIRRQLDAGNVWAWCSVAVRCSLEVDGQTFAGVDYLGACSYPSRAAFETADGYLPDMKGRAFEDLTRALEDGIRRGEVARGIMPATVRP